jgi:hypothetical protein
MKKERRVKKQSEDKKVVGLLYIDWKIVEDLLKAGCEGTETAAFLGICQETLYERCKTDKGMNFIDYKQQFRSRGDAMLRKAQFDLSLKGNVPLLLKLGEYRLGQNKHREDESSYLRTDILIEQEVRKRVAAALLEAGSQRSALETQQPLFHQGSSRKEDSVSDERVPEGTV